MREPLRKNLERAAAKKGVSMNAELVDRLERSFHIDQLEFESKIFSENAKKRWLQSEQNLIEAQKHSSDSNFIFAQIKELLEEWRDDRAALIKASELIEKAERLRSRRDQLKDSQNERQHHPTRKE
jgi:hypothetical protein